MEFVHCLYIFLKSFATIRYGTVFEWFGDLAAEDGHKIRKYFDFLIVFDVILP